MRCGDGMPQLGPVDPATGRGGPIYSALIIENSDDVLAFYVDGLGLELRSDRQFKSSGSKGALGVPDGTERFLVSLVDLNLNGFDHGSGFVDNDGSGIIARGAVKGSYNGPDPPYPNLKHSYEITVEALDEKGTVIGIGKKA